MAHDTGPLLLVSLLLGSTLATFAVGQAEAAAGFRSTLRVGYLGAAEPTPRSEAFVAFLRERYARVEVWSRDDCDPRNAGVVDVVLLDWPADDGVMRWMQEPASFATTRSPLGPRAAWSTPTVLLGSAGLNLASLWSAHGSSG